MLCHYFSKATWTWIQIFGVQKFLNSTRLVIKRGLNFWENGVFNYKRLHFWRFWVIYTIFWTIIFYKNSIFVSHLSLILGINKMMTDNSREIFYECDSFKKFFILTDGAGPLVPLSMCAPDSILLSFYVTEHILDILQHLRRWEAPNDSGAPGICPVRPIGQSAMYMW